MLPLFDYLVALRRGKIHLICSFELSKEHY